MYLIEQLPAEKLTLKDEARLTKSPEGQTDLVLHNMAEAFYYAKHISRSRLPDDELFSLSYTALTNAARNYKPERNKGFKGSRFFGYAKPYVRGEICRTWNRMKVVHNADTISLDGVIIALDHGRDDWLSLEKDESVVGSLAPDNFDTYKVEADFDGMHLRERWSMVEPLMRKVLTDQERMVLDLFYMGGFNFQQIGKLLGISRSAIQSSHSRAIKKLRGHLFRERKLFNA